MRELVLGGDGLIGAALTDELQSKGHSVVSLDLRSDCDIRYVDDGPFEAADRIWFLAWDTGGAKYIGVPDKQHQMYKHNCELSARVFDALSRTGRPFLFTTSQLAGQPNAYGLTKLMAETWAARLGGKIARLWNTYGFERPNVRSHVITDLVLSGLVDGRVRCMTRGLERRRFIYKTDCVAALIELFEGPQAAADIAGPEWVTIQQAAFEVADQLNVDVEFGSADGEEVMVGPERLLLDRRPNVSLTEGISRVISDARLFLERDLIGTEIAIDVSRRS